MLLNMFYKFTSNVLNFKVISMILNYYQWKLAVGPSWSYGSLIYNYLCNQSLAPLTQPHGDEIPALVCMSYLWSSYICLVWFNLTVCPNVLELCQPYCRNLKLDNSSTVYPSDIYNSNIQFLQRYDINQLIHVHAWKNADS
jgi:hypothetical protein